MNLIKDRSRLCLMISGAILVLALVLSLCGLVPRGLLLYGEAAATLGGRWRYL